MRVQVSHLHRAALYLVVAIGSIISMFPFAWMALTSGKDVTEIYTYPPTFWPKAPLFVESYTAIWTVAPFGRWLFNSAYVTTLALVGIVISASLVAYSFARFKYPGRDAIFLITLATMMLPSEVTLIPTYWIFKLVGWIDTFNPLIVPFWFGGGAFYIFLMRQFFLGIPVDLDEAAEIDGASSWDVFWRILMPLSKPALATTATLGFIHQWNSFLGPLIYLSSRDNFTVVLGLRYFMATILNPAAHYGPPMENLLMAAVTVVALPGLILFFVAQKYFVQGIALTGIKG